MSNLKRYLYLAEAIFSLIYAKINAFDDTTSQFVMLFIMFFVCMLPAFWLINSLIEKMLDK